MKTNIDVLQHLDDLISHLTDLHAEISGKWSEMQGNEEQPNLKRKQVRDVVVDIPLYEMVLGYRMFLTSLDQCPIVRFGMEGFDVRCRTKMPNSVQSKTERYLNMEHRGHVSMNKCFNDLFGIRAIMDTEVTHAEIRDHILGTREMHRLIQDGSQKQRTDLHRDPCLHREAEHGLPLGTADMVLEGCGDELRIP